MTQSSIDRAESKLIRKLDGLSNLFVGVDVHKRSYAVAVFSPEHRMIIDEFAMPADVQQLVRILSNVREKLTLCVYEAGFTGFALARALTNAHIEAGVVSPASIPRNRSQDTKTDRIDAAKLAEYAANGQLKFANVLNEKEDEERQLSRHRNVARKRLTQIMNSITSFLDYNNIKAPEGLENWRKDALKALATMPLSELLRFELDMILENYGFAKKQLERYMSALRKLTKSQDHTEQAARLQKIPGVGLLTVTTNLVEMPRPERFGTAEQVAKYVGLSPRLKQGGETKQSLGLTFAGNRHLRHVLIEAAWRWQRFDESAKRRYLHLKRSTGCGQKAIAGLARKLAIVMWKMRVDGTQYQPGGNPNRGPLGSRTGT